MRNIITKIIAHPLGLYIIAAIMPNVNYGSFYEIVTVGLVLAALAFAFDILFIRSISHSTNAIIKAIIIGIVVWLSQFVFIGAYVSMWGAIATGIILGIVEYIIVRYVAPYDYANNPS